MKRNLILLLLIFYCSKNFSQNKIYLDENIIEIDSLEFIKKCKFKVFKCLVYKTDSIIINKVLNKYNFGKIKKKEYHQIRKLLIKNQNRLIDSSSALLINYRDSLYDFITRKKNFENHVKKHDSVKHVSFSFKKFDSNRKRWIKKQKKCIKKVKRKHNAETFYVYNFDFGSIKDYPDLNWIKDIGVFKRVFFSVMYESSFLILKPNGNYFLSGGHLGDKMLKKLIRTENWTNFIKDLKTSKKNKNTRGVGFFNNNLIHNKSHCF